MTSESCLQPHLTSDELRERYRHCAHAADKTRWHALWLVSQGKANREVGRLVDRSHTWVNRLIRAYNAQGPDAVPTHKRAGEARGGKKPALEHSGLLDLGHALDHQTPPGGGLWTGGKVSAWIEEKTGYLPDRVTGWRYLQKLGYSLQTSRPAHPEGANEEQRVAFQKNSRVDCPASSAASRQAGALVFSGRGEIRTQADHAPSMG